MKTLSPLSPSKWLVISGVKQFLIKRKLYKSGDYTTAINNFQAAYKSWDRDKMEFYNNELLGIEKQVQVITNFDIIDRITWLNHKNLWHIS